VEVTAERRFLALAAVGDKASERMKEGVERGAVTGMFDLADVLELSDNRLDERAPAQ
jgi:hypothetical protein